VGQVKPARRPDARRAGGVAASGSNGARTPDAEADPAEAHAPARDHAAAGVRPAGEPLARARDLVGQCRVHEAIQLYLGILTVNSSNLKAHNNLGVLYDELKRFDSALEHFQAAEQLAPENVEVLANYASTLTSLARYDQAEELLRRAQRLAPEDVQARLGIGILYFRRGLYALAETELRWVCARDESHGPAQYYRGEALNRLNRYDEAAEAMERAITLIPSDPRPFYTLGHLYDRRHQQEEAAEMYRRARRLQTR
jgi:tetratricopeptide (TPR) repeat protein